MLGRANALSMARLRTGVPGPLPSPEEAAAHDWSPAEEQVAQGMASKVSIGTPEQVAEDLLRKAREADADELMITTAIHDPAERRQSVRLVAEALGASAARRRLTPPERTNGPFVTFYRCTNECRSLRVRRPTGYSAAMMSSTRCFASPKIIEVASLKNSGFCTPA